MYVRVVRMGPARYEIVLRAAQPGDGKSIITGTDLDVLFSSPYQLSTASVSQSLHELLPNV
jgi:hypothetical protein